MFRHSTTLYTKGLKNPLKNPLRVKKLSEIPFHLNFIFVFYYKYFPTLQIMKIGFIKFLNDDELVLSRL